VEVKAHLRTASVIDLAIRELREYARRKAAGPKARWQLWNVEQLAIDEDQEVTITPFTDIPEEAVAAKLLRVGLRRCA